jgi:hypothetical protein
MMPKREVNAMSKGRAAKGKRETIPRTRTTSTGAQQFDRGAEAITNSAAKSSVRGVMPAWSAAMDKEFPGRGYDKMEARMVDVDKKLQEKLSAIDEAEHKRTIARNRSTFKDGGMVDYDAKMARLDYPGTKGVSMPDAGKQQLTGKGFRGTF